tara:strand:- start:717 stop:1031 length:315 start_codon:yes stop_codon:yes gene_type:complete
MASIGEMHAHARAEYGKLDCGCARWDLKNGCDHYCDESAEAERQAMRAEEEGAYCWMLHEKPDPKVPFEALDESLDTLLGCRKFFPQCLDVVSRLHDKSTAGLI